MLSYVLDTDVIVAALRSASGASRQLLLGLIAAEVSSVLDDLAAVCRPVGLAFRYRPQLSDPDDEMVLETAINGGASGIVTFNRRDFATACIDFGCTVLLPVEALQRLRRTIP
jgi:predicted nucleic acid-binding protein